MATDTTTFQGGSPVSDPSNPYDDAVTIARGGDILGTLPVESHQTEIMDDLDAYGSNPVTSDSATERPLNPPTSVV